MTGKEDLRALLAEIRTKEQWDRARARDERIQRDMGIGYLIYLARARLRMSRRRFAKRIGTSQSAIARWEHGLQLPTISTLQAVAAAADLELVIGWKKPYTAEDEVWALGVVFDEQTMTELHMLIDDADYRRNLQPAPWRVALENEYVTDEMRAAGMEYLDFADG